MGESRGYGITRADVEASRLVFVSVRNSLPKRKVAVPVPDGFTWQQFLEQVKTKLRLDSVGAIYLASSGEKISSLDGLEDIDELYVEEGSPQVARKPPNGVINKPLPTEAALRAGGEASTSEIQYAGISSSAAVHRQSSAGNHHVVMDDNVGADGDDEEKYIKRSTFVKRMAQRIFPDAFAPSLPVATRASSHADDKAGGRKRRRHRGGMSRNTCIMLGAMLASMGMMFFLYWKLLPASG